MIAALQKLRRRRERRLERRRKRRARDPWMPHDESSAGSAASLSDEDEREIWEDCCADKVKEEEPPSAPSPTGTGDQTLGFFEDEIRCFQLLRNAKLAPSERQTLLAHTRNSTSFGTIRSALITWWENDQEVTNHDRPGRVYAMGGWSDNEDYWQGPDDDG